MNTPILSKKQQKRALSAKKGPAKGLRNVLAQPYDPPLPTICRQDCSAFEQLLKRILPKLKRPSIKFPWSKFRKFSKEDRARIRKEARDEKNSLFGNDVQIRNNVIIGVNSVTRSLEKGKLCSILLDQTVEPLLLIKHIVFMARAKKIAVLLVPFLKTVTLNTIDFSCAALALKECVAQCTDNYFYGLHEKICDVVANLPTSDLPVSLSQKLNDSAKADETKSDDSTVKDPKIEKPYLVSTDIYKYRSSRMERAFVPPSKTPKHETVDDKGNNFIAVDKDLEFVIDDDEMMKKRKKARYVDVRKDTKEALAGKESERMEVGSNDCIALRSSPNSSSSVDENIALYNIKSNVLGNESALEGTSIGKATKKRVKDVKYVALKVKRLQGCAKRAKASKAPKLKKKS